jgi:hypothetical protein
LYLQEASQITRETSNFKIQYIVTN